LLASGSFNFNDVTELNNISDPTVPIERTVPNENTFSQQSAVSCSPSISANPSPCPSSTPSLPAFKSKGESPLWKEYDMAMYNTSTSQKPLPIMKGNECDGCGRKFQSLVRLKEHKSQRHPQKLFSCGNPECPPFDNERSFRRHLETTWAHMDDKNRSYKCHCGRNWLRWDKFKSHINQSHKASSNPSTFDCICGKAFVGLNDIVTHHNETHMRKRGRPSGRRAGN